MSETPVESWALGIDLAWSEKNPTGLALARVTEDAVQVVATASAKTDDDILAFAARGDRPLTIAIDAPTVVPNETGMRPCERQLQAMFGRYHAGPYPANRRLLGGKDGRAPRGERLSARFARECGAAEGLPIARHNSVSVFEVFPAPALVRLFRLERGLIYKKKSGRSWETCRAGLSSYIERLRCLAGPELAFDPALVVGNSKGVAFKSIEDKVDAILCAYLASLGWLHGGLRLEMIGDLISGYVMLPRVHSSAK